MAREDPPPLKKHQVAAPDAGAILDVKSAVVDTTWATNNPISSSSTTTSSKSDHVLADFTVYTHAPPVYVDAKSPHADDHSYSGGASVVSVNTRKRQLPTSPQSYPRSHAGAAFADFKLDFAGYEMGGGPLRPAALHHPLYAASEVENPHEVIELLKSLHLTIRLDPAVMSQVADKLMYYGFDSALALAFATMEDLQHCGLHNQVDYQAVFQHTRRDFAARHFQGPGVFSNAYAVSRWLLLCGIPRKSAYEYTERLCRLGYPSVCDFELIVHDERALSEFRIGHRRLFVFCVTTAITQSQSQPQHQHQQSQHMPAPHAINLHHHYGAVYDGGSSSTLMQPLEIHRETEFDSFLDALIDPSAEAARYGGGGAADSYHHHQYAQPHHHHVQQAPHQYHNHRLSHHSEPDGSGESDGEYADNDFFRSAANSADQLLMNLSYGDAGDVGTPSGAPMRALPGDVVQLLYEAVNMPRPNPCRRGKKIYWHVLANKGMKEERFEPLENFTAAELQNAYLRQYELPATSASSKTDSWSEDNIRQLENAVKDPRCRHLSKVCWEMLATGRTGVDEYTPLAKFTASQLRSRFRSLFGDKRPQKLRQKKQLLKLQQQENLKKLQ
ncbi:hypothetical protein PybrP1_007775 [[Pythium] brassicae (nom. inval.)]|nr:hypothetical protein PybrP1_007775 [[Pythium] brassicae (nom. inval.)]